MTTWCVQAAEKVDDNNATEQEFDTVVNNGQLANNNTSEVFQLEISRPIQHEISSDYLIMLLLSAVPLSSSPH